MDSRRVSRILIVNAHSQANAGDQAIVLGQLRLLKNLFPAAKVAITSRTPALDRPALAAWGVEVIAPLFHSPAGFRDRWRGCLNAILSLVFPLPAWVFLRRLRRADLVFACGGGYFYSSKRIPGFTFWQNFLHLRLAACFKKEISFFPQSYGPLANPLSRRLLAGLLASEFVRAVFAREEISLAALREILPAGAGQRKLQPCPDMAFDFSPELEPFSANIDLSGLPHPRLALALRDWDFPGQTTRKAKLREREAYLQAVVAACQALHRKHGSSFFIFSQAQGPSSAEDDRRMADHIHGRLRTAIPHTHLRLVETAVGASPSWIVDLLRQADMLLTSRMHAAILSFLAGTPAAVIAYQHKSLGVLRSMDLEAFSLPIEKMDAEALFTLCAAVLRDRDAWQKRIQRAVGEARTEIEKKFAGLF
jgi:colanic acid/amylovoran biosynthesis protein